MSTALTPTAESTGHQPSAARRRSPLLGVGVLVLLVLLTLALAWHRRWTADDAFINFRAVRNILDGNGPVFNAGERIEVGTSPLWLWLLAGCDALLPFDTAWIAVGLGALGSAVGVLFAALGAMQLVRRAEDGLLPRRLFVPAGTMVFLAVPATWDFLTSGLETGLTFGWLGAVWFGVARQAASATPTRPVWLMVVVGLGPLIRPDLSLVSGLFGLWLLVAVPSGWWRRVADVGIALALPLGYEVFRMGWFGLLVPNTAVAKESTRAVWGRGWRYLGDLVGTYDLVVPLAVSAALLVLTALGSRWSPRVTGLVGVTVFTAVLYALFVVRVGGDFMHGRLLLPSLFLLLCPAAVVPVPSWRSSRLLVVVSGALVVALAAWVAVCAVSLRVDYPAGFNASGIADERGFYTAAAGVGHPVTLADHGGNGLTGYGEQVNAASAAGRAEVFVQDSLTVGPRGPQLVPVGRAAEGTTFLVYQAGYLGYAVGDEVEVLDTYGLSDGVGAHLEPSPPGRAGHEKALPTVWFWARYGAGLPERPTNPDLGPVTPAGVADAQAALACGDLADLVAATEAPMSWGRFWDNLTGAPARTSLRIPTDPHEARARFC
jgi:arabinofuranosyltransferase